MAVPLAPGITPGIVANPQMYQPPPSPIAGGNVQGQIPVDPRLGLGAGGPPPQGPIPTAPTINPISTTGMPPQPDLGKPGNEPQPPIATKPGNEPPPTPIPKSISARSLAGSTLNKSYVNTPPTTPDFSSEQYQPFRRRNPNGLPTTGPTTPGFPGDGDGSGGGGGGYPNDPPPGFDPADTDVGAIDISGGKDGIFDTINEQTGYGDHGLGNGGAGDGTNDDSQGGGTGGTGAGTGISNPTPPQLPPIDPVGGQYQQYAAPAPGPTAPMVGVPNLNTGIAPSVLPNINQYLNLPTASRSLR